MDGRAGGQTKVYEHLLKPTGLFTSFKHRGKDEPDGRGMLASKSFDKELFESKP